MIKIDIRAIANLAAMIEDRIMPMHASSEEKIGFQGQETVAHLQQFEENVFAEIGQTKNCRLLGSI